MTANSNPSETVTGRGVVSRDAGGAARTAFLMLAGLVVAGLAISGQSFWIDETLTAWKASLPDLGSWWRGMVEERASDLQMPLYMVGMWGWEKVMGHGEWALRSANIAWFLAGLLALHLATRSRLGVSAGVVLLASPFAWYYLDEARPYAMQLGAACVVVASLIRLLEAPEHLPEAGGWTRVFVLGGVSLAGSSLIGMVWLAGFCGVLVLLVPWRTGLAWLRRQALWVAGGLAVLAALGVYYLWTLKLGARATASATTDLRTAAFVGYELLGFGGVGPGRIQLRESGLAALRPHWPLLGLFGAFAGATAIAGVAGWWRILRPRVFWTLAVLVIGASVGLLAIGVLTHFRVLGRHFTPLWPVLALVLAAGVSGGWGGGRWRRMAAVGFVAVSVISAGSYRWAPRHARDDYRGAAAWAKKAVEKREIVWWNAEKSGGEFYGLSFAGTPGPGQPRLVLNPVDGFAAGWATPDLVVTSKRDIYDAFGQLGGYLERNGFRPAAVLPAFTVWRRETL